MQPSLHPGARVDRYVIESTLGSGGFGTVYRAKHTFTDRTVALKLLRLDHDGSSQLLDRFMQEARASTAIGSPHIVQVLDAGVAQGGQPFLAMELLDGEDLQSRLERRRKMRPDEAIAIAQELLRGLGAAHARGIVHRDLKPANVFLARGPNGEDHVKILDFGISKMRQPGRMDGLTRTGMVLGTPSYMSPEQFRGARDVDGRADLYSVSVILYEMLSGKVPFHAESYESLLLKVFSEPPIPLARVAPDVPMPLVYVIERGLARDADARWQSADDLAEALSAAQRGDAPLAGAPSTARTGLATDSTGPMPVSLAAPATPPTRVWSESVAPAGSPAPIGTQALPAAQNAVDRTPPTWPTGGADPRGRRPPPSGARMALIGATALLAAGLAAAGVVGVLSMVGADDEQTTSYGVAPAQPDPPADTAPTEPPKPLPSAIEEPESAPAEPEVTAGDRPAGRSAPTKRAATPPSDPVEPPAVEANPSEPPMLPASISGISTSAEVLSPNIPVSSAEQIARRVARTARVQLCRRGTAERVRVQVLVGLNGTINIAQPDPTGPHGDDEVARCIANVVRAVGPVPGTEMGGIFYVNADLRAR